MLPGTACLCPISVLPEAEAGWRDIRPISGHSWQAAERCPLLGELKWDKDKQYRVASNIKPFQAADRIGQVLGSVVFRLPYSQELEEQYLAGELLADLSMKDSRAFRKEIDRICEEVF